MKGIKGKKEVQLLPFLTSVLDGGELTSRPGSLYPGERTPVLNV